MKTFTIAAVALGILAAATASAQAQPIEDEAATNLTARTLKRCLAAYDWDKKAYKPDEISEYCSCYAVTLINMTTQEEYDIATATGKWPDRAGLKNLNKTISGVSA